MPGTFNLGEVGEYTPQAVMPNDFLNERLENEMYGIYYSVQFVGDAETYLLQAKKAPEIGKPEWGMIEMAKSGKSKRFKRVKREDAGGSKSVADYEPSTNARWAIGMAYRAFIQVTGSPEGSDGDFPFGQVEQHATQLIKMFSKIKDSGTLGEVSTPSSNKSFKEVVPAAGTLRPQTAVPFLNDEPLPSDEDMPND